MAESKRPTWDEYFLRIAKEAARRSTCIRRKVGAVLVKDKRILATGYNGAPSGLAHCLDIGCLREQKGAASGTQHELCRGLHAEQNAMLQAALHGVSVRDSVLYSTHQPCSLCVKMLINAGIIELNYIKEYPDELAIELLDEAGIEHRAHPEQIKEDE